MKRFEHGGNIYGRNIKMDFSVNTNPLGMCEEIKAAALGAADVYGVYPDAHYSELKSAIAEYENVTTENITVSNGASEMIFAVVRAVMPKRALLAAPTFSEYERALLSVGCEIEYYDTLEDNDFEVDADILNRAETADMMFVCNPNNPTGRLVDEGILDRIAQKNVICVADECFMELADARSAKGRFPVIKAFTKTYAMAGLRLGYLVADADFKERVQAQLPAWNVSAAAAAAGIAAIGCGRFLEKSVKLIKKERACLAAALSEMGFKVFPSDANFLLVKGAEGIGEKLLKRGILLRECDNFRGLDGRFYRIAVRTHEENEALAAELRDICVQS